MDTDGQKEKFNAMGRAQWEAEERRILVSRILRWGFGVPLMLLSFPIPWFGPFLMLLGAIMIAPDVAGYIARIVTKAEHPVEPKPLYGIPESLMARGDYEKAEKEYEKIIEEFPDEVKPHVDLINIAVMRLNDAELAGKLYQKGMRDLKDADARDVLTKMYKAVLSRLKKS